VLNHKTVLVEKRLSQVGSYMSFGFLFATMRLKQVDIKITTTNILLAHYPGKRYPLIISAASISTISDRPCGPIFIPSARIPKGSISVTS